MYCLIILISAPPQELVKYDGDHNTPFQYFFEKEGNFSRNFLKDTPFKLLTNFETAI